MALRYFHIAHEWRRSIELEARARIRALQAGIQPHFLFNSMNAIAALTRTDPARAEEAIEDLSDLFRFNLADAHGQITLREELEVARAYQRIEQLRLGDRLQVSWLIGDMPADALVPSLVMQPLLENAIGHGIESLSEGGTVTIHGRVAGETIEIGVSNPMSPDRRRASSGHRIALDNIRQRLELAYPGRSSVTVDDSGDHYRVTLQVPAGARRAATRACRSDPATQPDDDVDAGDLGAGRQRGHPRKREVLGSNVDHFAGVEILEVMVRLARRVVHTPIRIEMNLSHESVLDEKLEGVVHRRLRHPRRRAP